MDTGKDIMHCVETMDQIHNMATIMNDFKDFMTTYIGFLSIMTLELLPNSVFSSYFSSKINYKISDNLRSYTLNKELLPRLLSDADDIIERQIMCKLNLKI